jgi:hypothetical protein
MGSEQQGDNISNQLFNQRYLLEVHAIMQAFQEPDEVAQTILHEYAAVADMLAATNLGMVYDLLLDNENALRWLNRGVAESNAPGAKIALGLFLDDKDDVAHAVLCFTAAAEDGDSFAMVLLADALDRQGKTKFAQMWRDRAGEDAVAEFAR